MSARHSLALSLAELSRGIRLLADNRRSEATGACLDGHRRWRRTDQQALSLSSATTALEQARAGRSPDTAAGA
jgi:hypothetical protein